jgi:hypothetical protein
MRVDKVIADFTSRTRNFAKTQVVCVFQRMVVLDMNNSTPNCLYIKIEKKWEPTPLGEFDLNDHEGRVNAVLKAIKLIRFIWGQHWGQGKGLKFTGVKDLGSDQLRSPIDSDRKKLDADLPFALEDRPRGELFYCNIKIENHDDLEAIVEILPPLPNSESWY